MSKFRYSLGGFSQKAEGIGLLRTLKVGLVVRVYGVDAVDSFEYAVR